MEKEFVSYEIALALKELGFDEECLANYWEKLFYYKITFNHPATMPNSPESCLAPLKQQVFRWFRNKYDAHIHPTKLMPNVYIIHYGTWTSITFNTYEEAESACIDKFIELAKQDNEKI
jgi:hypothetical protein